jgi:hypothetical protein
LRKRAAGGEAGECCEGVASVQAGVPWARSRDYRQKKPRRGGAVSLIRLIS